ncbi:hypothetical protein [Vibrio hangzhouensis]|uniref:Uncharacterized protein n=1 Tax=Vibrio hangzhouensis TaxID=462991 RepID=A0A1H5WY42_9VIBR|nr:hypothetical protein [Vibrio hangzhouensis]MBY6198124.1 hypothetical protein [Vibrio hangzhouensis]SEG04422.1 hypothetical protein SAMN04488244_106123 [Vibrio hangzhouensis]
MKKLILAFALSLLANGAYADAAKGQEYYLEHLRPLFGYNGEEFATQHLKVEWKRYFKKDAAKFIKKYSKKHPESAEFLASDEFQTIAPDIRDFAIKYAADSGELPACN